MALGGTRWHSVALGGTRWHSAALSGTRRQTGPDAGAAGVKRTAWVGTEFFKSRVGKKVCSSTFSYVGSPADGTTRPLNILSDDGSGLMMLPTLSRAVVAK